MSTPESLEDAGQAGPSSSAPCSATNTEPSAAPIVPSHSRADLALSEDSLAPVFVECLLCDPDCVGETRGEKDSPPPHQKKMIKPEPIRSSPGGFGGERVRAQRKKRLGGRE